MTKVDPEARLERICLLACGIPTGVGAAWNTAKVEAGSTVAIFGLGAVGLAVAEGARIAGASRIIGIDINASKFETAKQFGVTEFVNPRDCAAPIQEVLQEMTDGGADYCFECVGNVDLMLAAFQGCHEGWGRTVLVGVEGRKDKKLCLNPMELFDGREIKGSIFGDFKGKTHIQALMDMYKNKVLNVDAFVTHELPFDQINDAFQLLKDGKSLRCVMHMAPLAFIE